MQSAKPSSDLFRSGFEKAGRVRRLRLSFLKASLKFWASSRDVKYIAKCSGLGWPSEQSVATQTLPKSADLQVAMGELMHDVRKASEVERFFHLAKWSADCPISCS